MPRTRKHPFNISMKPIAQKIMASGRKRGIHGKRLRAYAYGALNKMGAKRGNITTKKGMAMMAEHKVGARGKLKSFEKKVRNPFHSKRGRSKMGREGPMKPMKHPAKYRDPFGKGRR